jgi:DNA modification methylase
MKTGLHRRIQTEGSVQELPYPDAKLVRRKRKVQNLKEKEHIRKGTKHHKRAIVADRGADMSGLENTIICGDSERVLATIPDNTIDIIITSPPYNFGLEYDRENQTDARHWDEYFAKLTTIWEHCKRVLRPGGRLIVNIQPLFSDYIPTHHIISKQLLDLGLLWKGEILWEKNHYNCKYTAWGSWKSPSMPYLKYTWEFVEIFCKETHKKTGDRTQVDITGEEFKKWVYARWSIGPERNMKQYHHPAMFPEELVVRLLKLFSYTNDLILDPFNGAGTTTAVAQRLGRRFIGIDVSKEYCNIAQERLRKIPMKLFGDD